LSRASLSGEEMAKESLAHEVASAILLELRRQNYGHGGGVYYEELGMSAIQVVRAWDRRKMSDTKRKSA